MTQLRHPLSCIVLVVAATSCRSDAVVSIGGTTSRTVSVAVGQELDVILQTVGPGEYESPPAISSDAVRFVRVTLDSPFVPAGPTQRFRFAAAGRGTAVISFRHTGRGAAIDDTVFVR